MISVAGLLEPITADEPCGPNMEYDSAFGDLETAARGKAEQQMGETVVAGEPPDWRDVAGRAEALLTQSKDLRVAVHLTKALLHTGGFVGIEQGLHVLKGLFEGYWDWVHPQLDPDDDNDPTIRFNILMDMCDGATLDAVRNAPLVSVRGLGKFSLRDLAIVSGELQPKEGEPKPDSTTVDAAFTAAPVEELKATADAARNAAKHTTEIETAASDRAGAAAGPNLSKLRALLDQAAKALDKRLALRVDGAEEGAVPSNGAEGAAGGAPNGGGAPGKRAALSGEITTREDVLKALDKILDYYSKYEPSSPVPLFMRRSKRLVTMSFEDIVKNMVPDALPTVEILRGPPEETSG